MKRMHKMVGAESGYSYAGSPIIANEPGNPTEWDILTIDPTVRPGIRIPHIWLSDRQAMQDMLGQDYTLLDLTGTADSEAIEAAFATVGAPLEVRRIVDPHVASVYDCTLVLVRPDLHIVWRGDRLPDDVDGLARRATGWGGMV